MKHQNNGVAFAHSVGLGHVAMPFITLAGRELLYSTGVALLLILGAQISFALQIDHNEGVVEWLQFALLFGGAGILALRSNAQGRWWRTLVVGAILVLAMEEIDWAQPYLGYTPLSILAKNNAYGEMALHNAFGMEKYLRMAVLLGVGAGGGVLLAKVGFKQGLDGLLKYASKTLLWPGALFGAGVMTLIAGRVLHPGDFFDFDEFGELAIYAGVILFALSRPLDVFRPLPRT